MNESPYRTAPPAEWPRSMRAAYAIGRCVSAAMPLRVFMSVVFGMAFAGFGLGFAVAHDVYARERPPRPPPICNIRSDWNGNEAVRYGFALLRDDDEKVGRFDSIDAAIGAAGKLGCRVEP